MYSNVNVSPLILHVKWTILLVRSLTHFPSFPRGKSMWLFDTQKQLHFWLEELNSFGKKKHSHHLYSEVELREGSPTVLVLSVRVWDNLHINMQIKSASWHKGWIIMIFILSVIFPAILDFIQVLFTPFFSFMPSELITSVSCQCHSDIPCTLWIFKDFNVLNSMKLNFGDKTRDKSLTVCVRVCETPQWAQLPMKRPTHSPFKTLTWLCTILSEFDGEMRRRKQGTVGLQTTAIFLNYQFT